MSKGLPVTFVLCPLSGCVLSQAPSACSSKVCLCSIAVLAEKSLGKTRQHGSKSASMVKSLHAHAAFSGQIVLSHLPVAGSGSDAPVQRFKQ